MSQENVELARAADDAWNAGHSDAMRWYEQLRSTWNAVVIETISRTDARDRVVARQIAHGAGRGPASKLECTTVTTVRKGKIVFLEFFWDHADALEAVGLE